MSSVMSVGVRALVNEREVELVGSANRRLDAQVDARK